MARNLFMGLLGSDLDSLTHLEKWCLDFCSGVRRLLCTCLACEHFMVVF